MSCAWNSKVWLLYIMDHASIKPVWILYYNYKRGWMMGSILTTCSYNLIVHDYIAEITRAEDKAEIKLDEDEFLFVS